MCLFVFGQPGSGKGELVFDLVEHSSLVDVLAGHRRLEGLASGAQEACPLFHYIDISALIVANIDERIREYNKLVARTLRGRRQQQLALVATRRESEELDGDRREPLEGGQPLAAGDSLDREQEGDSFDSSGQQDSAGNSANETSSCREAAPLPAGDEPTARSAPCRAANGQPDARRCSLEQQFGIMTLSTKQRSILQLKLMKYATCVTAKWIIILIKLEINELERRLMQLVAGTNPGHADPHTAMPRRVYLINLIPNQPTLFRACLYLEQNLCFGDLHRPYHAIKLERRTNISVLKKDKGIDKQRRRKLSEPSQRGRSLQFKLSHIKIPILKPLSKSISHESLLFGAEAGAAPATPGRAALVSVSSDVLAGGAANEKLGPKFNESFVRQFKACDHLLEVRYNPLSCGRPSRDCAACRPSAGQSGQSGAGESCFELLRRRDGPTGPPSPTPSSCEPPPAASQPGRQSSSLEQLCPLAASGPGWGGGPASSASMLELSRPPGPGTAPAPATKAGPHVPKWAVELELVSGDQNQQQQQHTPDAKENSAWTRQRQWRQPELHTYQAPSRAGSRSPLMSAASDRYQQLLNTSGHSSQNNYSLVPTQVAYANGASQTILEVKRLVHKRAFKFKSRADCVKLHKLIARARTRLLEDLESWLGVAIVTEAARQHRQPHQWAGPAGEACPVAAGGGPKWDPHESGARRRQPALVTHTIRVDLSHFKGGQHDGGCKVASHLGARQALPADLSRPQSARPDSAGERLRPSLKTRPASCISNEETTATTAVTAAAAAAASNNDESKGKKQPDGGQKRHVQFRLESSTGEACERPDGDCGPIERRVWLSECLFASCTEAPLLELMAAFVEMLQGPE